MDVFVAGASCAAGRPLMKSWCAPGIESPDKAQDLARLGAKPVEVDMFDRGAVERALARADPVAVIDEFTHLPVSPADLDAALPAVSRLRIAGGATCLRRPKC